MASPSQSLEPLANLSGTTLINELSRRLEVIKEEHKELANEFIKDFREQFRNQCAGKLNKVLVGETKAIGEKYGLCGKGDIPDLVVHTIVEFITIEEALSSFPDNLDFLRRTFFEAYGEKVHDLNASPRSSVSEISPSNSLFSFPDSENWSSFNSSPRR
jgi:hypothetical protein